MTDRGSASVGDTGAAERQRAATGLGQRASAGDGTQGLVRAAAVLERAAGDGDGHGVAAVQPAGSADGQRAAVDGGGAGVGVVTGERQRAGAGLGQGCCSRVVGDYGADGQAAAGIVLDHDQILVGVRARQCIAGNGGDIAADGAGHQNTTRANNVSTCGERDRIGGVGVEAQGVGRDYAQQKALAAVDVDVGVSVIGDRGAGGGGVSIKTGVPDDVPGPDVQGGPIVSADRGECSAACGVGQDVVIEEGRRGRCDAVGAVLRSGR